MRKFCDGWWRWWTRHHERPQRHGSAHLQTGEMPRSVVCTSPQSKHKETRPSEARLSGDLCAAHPAGSACCPWPLGCRPPLGRPRCRRLLATPRAGLAVLKVIIFFPPWEKETHCQRMTCFSRVRFTREQTPSPAHAHAWSTGVRSRARRWRTARRSIREQMLPDPPATWEAFRHWLRV